MAKSMIIGVILSILLGGIGTMYAGRFFIGLLLLLLEIIGPTVAYIAYGLYQTSTSYTPLIVAGAGAFVGFLAWLFAIIVTVKTINKKNGTNY